MPIQKLYAQLSCADLKTSAAWCGQLFGRSHDIAPMDGLKEWHHGDGAGFQLVSNPDGAGHGAMTLILAELPAEHERFMKAGLVVGDIVTGDFASFAQLSDPDGNTVVLAEPKADL